MPRRRANARNVSLLILYGGQFTFLIQLSTLNCLLDGQSRWMVDWQAVGRQTDRLTDKKTDRQADRRTHRQTGRQADTENEYLVKKTEKT